MSKASDSGSSLPPDLETVCDLLEKLWEIPPAQRAVWLNENCASRSLRKEVLTLLHADDSARDFLGPEAVERARPLLESAVSNLESGSRVGRFRIVRRIARGGMGEVFLAKRDSDDFEQTVAIKLVDRFSDSTDRRRRFVEERQILARLEHPNIARLIDGGIREDDEHPRSGRPYLVMEYVDGLPITEYCRESLYELNDRLEIFQTVCDAVHFAHQNLVIHRDLKPRNILVTATGQVKLLDFGIATMLSEDASAADSGTMLMTPEFAAPEQLRGEPLTTATDIYALGLLLKELVSGCKSGIAADLESIILKALAEEPGDRYPSARALSGDVENFLNDMPVTAYADNRGYRISKFIERHRWETVTVSMAAILLVAATIITAISAASARKALDQLQIEARKSDQVVDFLRSTFSAVDPRQTHGEKLSVEDVLESGRGRIDELADQPQVQGLLLSELGVIYTSLGNHQAGFELLEEARDLLVDGEGSNHEELGRTLVSMSIAKERLGDLEASEAIARELLELRQSAMPVDEAAVGEAMDRLGTAISGQGRYQDAEPLATGAVELLARHAGENDPRTLTALHNLAWLQGRLGQQEQAVKTYRRVVEIGEEIHGKNDPDQLVSLDSFAVALRRVGRLEEAEDLFRDTLARRIELLGEPHWEVGYTYHNLARLLFQREAYEQSIQLYLKALENWEPTLGAEHANVGVCLGNLARAQEASGDLLGAKESYQAATSILDGLVGFEDRLSEARAGLERLGSES